jgi:nucleotide-binding universal stress UspA family protein
MSVNKRIITLIDGSIYAASVCDLAAWAAIRTQADVELVHVLGRRDVASMPFNLSGEIGFDAQESLLEELAALDAQKARLAHQRGRMLLAQASTRVSAAGVSSVGSKMRHGDLTETVQDLQSDASLIVIGKRGEAADFAKLHLGSNLERVVRAADRPVLVAARSFQKIERMLIAFDNGPSVMRSISLIADGSLCRGLQVHLLMVGSGSAETRAGQEKAAATLQNAGYRVEAHLVPGEVDKVIAHHVHEKSIDLLAMGAFGHSRLRHLIIGSTTTEMIRSCKIPILLVR